MKCLAVVGSTNPKSISRQIADRWLNLIKATDADNIETHCFSLQDVSVKMCVGCEVCFFDGECPLDHDVSDSLLALKQELLSADIILIVSPIYFGNISGGTKCIIDRLSYWSHLLKLHRKHGVGIVVSDGNSYEEGLKYLSVVMESLGISVVENFALKRSVVRSLPAIDSVLLPVAHHCINLYREAKYPVSNHQRLLFKTLKMKLQNNPVGAEYAYWKEHKYFDCGSFDELVNKDHHNLEKTMLQV